ncbi:MAG: FHA domain-containing protein [Planctomycetes bacterium]|nr:FHA domain-containing protein [Planctomycetota bacterium]
MPQAELTVIEGRLKGQRFLVDESATITLGRSLKSNIQLPDQGISRVHCQIENDGAALKLSDLGSSNGTLVNGEKVDKCELRNGNVIAIGSSALLVKIIAPQSVEGGGIPSRTTVHLVKDERETGTAIRKKYDNQTALLTIEQSGDPDLQVARKRLAAICKMANTIYAGESIKDIIDMASRTILEITGADRSAIILVGEDAGDLRPVAFHSRENQAGGDDFPVSRTIVEESMNTGVSVISTDAAQDERFKLGASVVIQNIHNVMCAPLKTEKKIIGALYVDSSSLGNLFSENELALLAAVGQQVGLALERAKLVTDLENLFVGAMRTLIATIEAKDPYTRGHSERVTQFALMIASEMGLDSATKWVVELGGVLHDVGKIGVPEMVLLKPGKLDDDEYAIIMKHPDDGATIIENMPEIDHIVNMSETINAVRHHHERFDGKGYPAGLEGKEIPLPARILAVADTYDAITSDRPYRKGGAPEKAIKIISECSGSQFDPEIAEVFINVYKKGMLDNHKAVTGRFSITR